MNDEKKKNFLKSTGSFLFFVASRVLILYVIVVILFSQLFNVGNILDRAKAEELNEIMPSFGYLDTYDERQGPFDPERLEEYIHYYTKVNEFLPNEADVLSLLGYCYYYKNDIPRSVSYYQKAIKKNDHIFWFYYNLGVIYYKQKDYDRAIDYLQKAIDKKPEHALMFAGYSRSFRRIAHGASNFKEALEARVKDGYARALALLVMANYQEGKYNQAYSVAVYAMQMTSQYRAFFLYYAGMSTFKEKDFKKSSYFLKEFIKINPNHREAMVHLALSFKEIGADALAEITMKRAMVIKESPMVILEDKDIVLKIF